MFEEERNRFRRDGFLVIDSFLQEAECEAIRATVDELSGRDRLIKVDRVGRTSVSRFATINGTELERSIPRVAGAYAEVADFVRAIASDDLTPLENRAIGVSINVTSPGQQFAMHYDRNAVTAVIYLNSVESGGQMEFYPKHRLFLGTRSNPFLKRLQHVLDVGTKTSLWKRLSGQRHLVSPTAGRMLVFRGNRCLHGVRPVEGTVARYSLQLAYDLPAVSFARSETTDYYGYRAAA